MSPCGEESAAVEFDRLIEPRREPARNAAIAIHAAAEDDADVRVPVPIAEPIHRNEETGEQRQEERNPKQDQ